MYLKREWTPLPSLLLKRNEVWIKENINSKNFKVIFLGSEVYLKNILYTPISNDQFGD